MRKIFSLLLLFSINIQSHNLENFEIIELSPERFEEFRAIRLQAIKEVPHAFGRSVEDEQARSDEFYKDVLQQAAKKKDMWFVFAQKDNQLIGMAGAWCHMKDFTFCRHRAAISSVFVVPEYRSYGIGSALLNSLLNQLQESKIVKHVMLWVTASQTEAIDLYKKCGFEICGCIQDAVIVDNTCYDQFLMQKSLIQ